MKWSGQLFERSAKELPGFLTPVLAGLGRSERRIAATQYVQGLLQPGQRKSIEPMAQRLGADPQGLQHFVSDSPWSDEAVWTEVRRKIIPHLEPIEAWVVDETGWLKQGRHSVGVSQYGCRSHAVGQRFPDQLERNHRLGRKSGFLRHPGPCTTRFLLRPAFRQVEPAANWRGDPAVGHLLAAAAGTSNNTFSAPRMISD